MRHLALLLLAALSAASSAQVKLALTIGGKIAGTAVLSQHLNADGGKSVELRMEILSGGKKAHLSSQATYDSKGNPVRKFLETIVPGGQVQRQTITSFDDDGANAVVRTGDGRITKKVPLVSTAPRQCLSEFWFLRDKPKAGDAVKAYTFDPDKLEWSITETVYAGLKTIEFKGKKTQVHEVDTQQGDRRVVSYLDDKGLPWIIDDGTIRMERVSDK
jgi:hypothetical protein